MVANNPQHWQHPCECINRQGTSPFVLICEHASAYIPAAFNQLGLSEAERLSHIGWDLGAAATAKQLSGLLNAPLFLQRYSRLLYDCNRAPEEPSAIAVSSEYITIPGNQQLSTMAYQERVQAIYTPFHAEIATFLQQRQQHHEPSTLVSIHSFTPCYFGQARAVELGVIFAEDNLFAAQFLQLAQHYPHDVRANEPYSASDPVLHVMDKHGRANQLPHIMLEIRNNLLQDAESQYYWATLIADTLKATHTALHCLTQGESL